jgi:hypothetical protein
LIVQGPERKRLPFARDARQKLRCARRTRLGVAPGCEHRDAGGAQPAGHEQQELERGQIGAMQIVEHQQTRRLA